MGNERTLAAAPIFACVFTLVAFSLTVYGASYFWLGMGLANVSSTGDVVRTYRYSWLASAFYPAGYLERLATGRRVIIVGGTAKRFIHDPPLHRRADPGSAGHCAGDVRVSTASIASGLKLETIERRYPHQLLATVYAPVGRVEQYFRQTDVVLTFVGQFP